MKDNDPSLHFKLLTSDFSLHSSTLPVLPGSGRRNSPGSHPGRVRYALAVPPGSGRRINPDTPPFEIRHSKFAILNSAFPHLQLFQRSAG
jgi:hypothetical protein